MTTLLMRISAPMQSWGVQSRFEIRDTLQEPTKSGIVGLVCAAIGRDRSEPIDDIASLRMGVRVDREGQMRHDFHTAGKDGYYRANGNINKKTSILSTRYYLSDAAFLVGIESEDITLLQKIHTSLANPYWPIFFGRKAFVPGEPIYLNDGLQTGALDEVLRGYRWKPRHRQPQPQKLRLVIEDPDNRYKGNDIAIRITRPDYPISFRPRRFILREMIVTYCTPPIFEEESHESQ
ncbi:MAG: type I-E CRISPR-associated protein Cas5/CasD [Chlorobi bacterium CHB2]|nr:type I-E CRISPR-associated protein Cas5/CasD [Chlorobi bacterium CHB2]